ncbi:hypothetical protein FSP39_020606 [Pinctada imbricata]|uniref:protein-tyrosine-phosphatase n=1 Tax=Pinctada imbricata TaxID=66713 RepID=A0AA89BUQ1_PINIB|nr:hypothetical protein FSP39_020606 [Pinctada imbricata]
MRFVIAVDIRYGPNSIEADLNNLQRECKDGTFGYRCHYRCRCYNDRKCDKRTGECPQGRCAEGYWGPGCQLTNNCFYNGYARNYMGTKSLTDSLLECQHWETQIPHRHSYHARDFPDKKFPENYCRTTEDSARPWCYTKKKEKRWEHCNVNNCNCPAGRFGHNCEKECHCADISEACDSMLGLCSSGCAQGWGGYACQSPVACPTNRYGWDCTKSCYCKNPKHCNRFTGPSADCRCVDGYFNPPLCQEVIAPKFVSFSNVQVNPGNATIFNCTVTAYPTPMASEISLHGPPDRRIALLKSKELAPYLYTRVNLFRVDSVKQNEMFTCVVRGIAGTNSQTIRTNVYDLPVLVRPPFVSEEGPGVTDITIKWLPWSQSRGDKGDPPILWYNIYLRDIKSNSERKIGIATHLNCGIECNYTLDGLKPNTEYAIRISTQRIGQGGEGEPGPPLYTSTECSAPKLAPILHSVTSSFEYNSSYPETQIIVMWKDPPKHSWNCDNISAYQIHLSSTSATLQLQSVHVSGDTTGDSKNIKSALIPDLNPGTEYCVRMSFTNEKRFYSPHSDKMCTVTPSTTPSAPRNLKLIKRSSSSLTLSWQQPLLSAGTIYVYRLTYWKGSWRELSSKRADIQPSSSVLQHTIDNLEPHTQYSIEVTALNNAGAGETSNVLTVSTEESVPGEVTVLKNISRTDESITLSWQKPSVNGELLAYSVSCTDGQGSVVEANIARTLLRHTFRGLSPATHYSCGVHASTSKGSGITKYISVWTLATDPREPPSPSILERDETTITISLYPVEDKTVSFYRIIVEQTESNRIRKRGINDRIRDVRSDFQTAQTRGSSAYVAAQLQKDHAFKHFVVGDNQTYGGYYNAPLDTEQQYDVWYGAFSMVDGTVRKSFAKAARVEAPRVATAPENSHIPVIVAVIIVFILLILIFALSLFLWRKRHLASEREKAEMPNFGPTIIPEPETSTPSTPVDDLEIEPLIEPSSGNETECEPVYGNIGVCTVIPVKVEDLWDYVKANKTNDCEGFRKEYRLIPAGLTASCEIAKKTENKDKNRYGNIIAYDHSRVLLTPVSDDPTDDYSNANYIDGYKKSKAYIAAQGPTKPTVNDIWRMAWEMKSRTVIMLTNPTETGKKKCEQYWPDSGRHDYGGIVVEFVDVEQFSNFCIRTFQLYKGGEKLEVKQFHYTTWPDHGVPRFGHSILAFRQKIRAYDKLENGPPIVHCSAGVGRTGTYIAIDVNLEQAKQEGIIDVHNHVQIMRTQRVNMVQTLEQYIFVYDVLLEALICGETTVSVDAYRDTLDDLLQYDQSIAKTKIEEQYEVLNLITSIIERDETTTGLRPENVFKNRNKTIVPANRCRPYLITPVEDYNNYINAVFLDSFRRKDAYIITQMPLPLTAVDFWRLIYDHNSYCIVMLNEVDKADETCVAYWTLDTCGESFGPFIVETTAEIKSDPSVTVRDFTITNTLNPQEMPRVVRQFNFHRWTEGSAVPSSKAALLELLDNVGKWQGQSGNKPVTVHCLDGAAKSGLFVASSCILERVKTEKEVDVFQTIKQMRLNRPQLIDSLEQFKFCHEIALEFLNSSSQPNGAS